LALKRLEMQGLLKYPYPYLFLSGANLKVMFELLYLKKPKEIMEKTGLSKICIITTIPLFDICTESRYASAAP